MLSLPALAAEKKLKVVTTFLPAYSFAANIAGELAHVENLLPGNVSLHEYQLSPGEIRKLNRADLIVINGLGMEAFLDRALANAAKGTSGKIVRLGDGLDAELIRTESSHDHDHDEEHEHTHHHGEVNPHIWLDPILAAHGVTNILKSIQKLDPAQSSAYAKNAELYVARLHRLDQELKGMLQGVKSVPFITYHNAFPYFVKRYGLNLIGVVESVPEVSPSAREMSNLLRTIRESKVAALFTEPQEPARLARQIAKDTGIKLGELDPLETGTLKPESYEEGMRRNGRELVEALR